MVENDARPGGTDPLGEALRGLARAVSTEVGGAPALPLRARAARDRRQLRVRVSAMALTAATALAAAVVVVLLALSGGSHTPTATPPGPPSSSGFASHATTVGGATFVSSNLNQVVHRSARMRVRSSTIKFPVFDANSNAIAFGAGSTWILESTRPVGGPAKPLGAPDRADCGALVRLNGSTMATSGTVSLKECPVALAFADGSVWVLGMQIGIAGYQVTRVDPARMTVQASTIIDGGAAGVVPQGDTGAKNLFVSARGATATAVVQTAAGASQVVTVDAKTLQTVAAMTIPQARGDATALAAGKDVTWLGTDQGWVYRIASRTGQIATARHLGEWVHSLSVSRQGIWMTTALPEGKPASAYPGLDTLELNPKTGAVRHDTGLPLLIAAATDRQVWGIFSTRRNGNYIARIQPSLRTVTGMASSPFKGSSFTPDTIGVNDGAAWIINTKLQSLTKVLPTR